MVADEAREVERDGHAGFADVACRRSGDLVKAIDDGVAVNGESLCGQDEVEPAFAPGDKRVAQAVEVIFAMQACQL